MDKFTEKRYCKKCGARVERENELDYPFYCPRCDENVYAFETEGR